MHSGLKVGWQIIRLSLVLLLIGFGGCAPLATVRYSNPRPAVTRDTDPRSGEAESDLTDGRKLERRYPTRALGEYLACARLAFRRLERRPSDTSARDLYNFSVARCVEIIETAPLDPWSHSLVVPGPDGEYSLTTVRHAGRDRNPADHKFIPTDTMTIGGSYFHQRTVIDGIGAPLVAIGREQKRDFRETYATRLLYRPATAVIRFNDHRARLDVIDPFTTYIVKLDGRDARLAADFTAPLAVALVTKRPEKLGLSGLLHPGKYSETAQLLRLQPYDPDRVPVIFVHGLQDTPAVWAPMVNALLGDPEIRRHYQFWFYGYPSGFPYPYSAMVFRHDLDGIARAFPDHKRVVLVGHSMGGLICRLLVTDAGDKIWRDLFGTTPAKTPLRGETRQLLEKMLIFNHRPDVKRVIFIATPQRGSELASDWIGRIGSGIIGRPRFLASLWASAKPILTTDPAAAQLTRVPDSIDELEPNDRFLLALNKLPIAPGIPYNSIIGDRGRGDTPNSSDGVVAYWSSHLAGAQSELIVPSDHSNVERNPEAIAELERILKAHP